MSWGTYSWQILVLCCGCEIHVPNRRDMCAVNVRCMTLTGHICVCHELRCMTLTRQILVLCCGCEVNVLNWTDIWIHVCVPWTEVDVLNKTDICVLNMNCSSCLFFTWQILVCVLCMWGACPWQEWYACCDSEVLILDKIRTHTSQSLWLFCKIKWAFPKTFQSKIHWVKDTHPEMHLCCGSEMLILDRAHYYIAILWDSNMECWQME